MDEHRIWINKVFVIVNTTCRCSGDDSKFCWPFRRQVYWLRDILYFSALFCYENSIHLSFLFSSISSELHSWSKRPSFRYIEVMRLLWCIVFIPMSNLKKRTCYVYIHFPSCHSRVTYLPRDNIFMGNMTFYAWLTCRREGKQFVSISRG